MARLSEKQSAAARSLSSVAPGRAKSRVSFGGIAILLLLAILPVALPIYMPSELQQQFLSTLETYLPAQLKGHFSRPQNASEATNTQQQLSPEQLLEACKVHQYNSQIISLSPLVIYIQNFTSAQEAEELINIGSPDFAESFISRSRGGNQRVTGRTSTSAPLDTSHPLVDCILSRARGFMGSMLLPHEPFSTPQLVRYFPGQKYDLHTDFWPEHQIMNDGSNRLFNRVASFFVFLRDNCTGGYTYFPSVEPTGFNAEREVGDEVVEDWYGEKVKRGEREVGEDVERGGVMFKPIQGNAVFWVNVGEDGIGDRRVVHAGLPVIEGEKIGLNIWPRKFYGRADEGEEKKERKGWSGKWKD